MPGFIFGDFAGGVAEGIQRGQEIREKYDQITQQELARKAQERFGQMLLQKAQQAKQANNQPVRPVQGAPGLNAPPGGAPTQVPVPGATLMQPPPQAQAPQPPVQAGPAQGSPAPAPQPAAPAGGAPGGPTTGNAPGGSGDKGDQQNPYAGITQLSPMQVMQQSQDALQAIATEIYQSDPNKKWKPDELLASVDAVVERMDKLDPATKIAMQAQIAGSMAQYRYWDANLKDARAAAGQQGRAQTAADKLAEDIRHHKASEATATDRTAIYGQMATWSHEDRQTAIAAANERASQAVDSREKIAAQHDADEMDRLDRALEDKDWATVNQIMAGEYRAQTANAPVGQPPAAPKITPKPNRVGAPAAGGGSAAAASAPPASALKKGVHTTFANGQTWTLDDQGKPKRVK